jgi:hypothetical protein
MYGLAAVGDAVVPGLVGLLRALLAAPDQDQEAQHTTVMGSGSHSDVGDEFSMALCMVAQ